MSGSMIQTATLLLLVSAGAAQAQSPLGLEVRGGAAFATADLGDATLRTGGGLELTGTYRVMQHIHVYAGWDYHSFPMDTPFGGAKYDVDLTGYAFGLQFQHPLAGRLGGWLRAGGMYSHIELENDAGTTMADSGHEFGWEVGGGLRLPLGSNLALTPGVRYRTLSADLDVGEKRAVDLSFVAVEAGLSWTFGSRASMAMSRK